MAPHDGASGVAEVNDEIAALSRLSAASGRLWRARRLSEGLEEMLAASIELLGADKGNIQIMDDAKRALVIVAQRGFETDFLDFFREVSTEDDSACGRALRSGDRIVIEDVETDAAYAPLRHVARAAGYRGVQSTPLIGRDGAALGMISTHWALPHRPSEQDLRRLDLYARQASDFIERIRMEEALQAELNERKKMEAILRESENRFRALSDSVPALIWVNDLQGCAYVNRSYLDFLGVQGEDVRGFDWSHFIDPDDRDAYVQAYLDAVAKREPFEADFRFRRCDGEYRWMRTTGQPRLAPNGELNGYAGVTIDITERRQAEEMQRMLTAELSHRVKNMLATVQAVASQTLRHDAQPAAFVAKFSGRIQSMARVHSLLSSTNWRPADLRELIRDQLLSGPIDETRVVARGPSVALEPQLATQVAMMLHELGTNSIKYGALSNPNGAVTIVWSVDNDVLHLQWADRGGPPVKAPIARGFGTALIEQNAKSVGGAADLCVEAEGVRWSIALPLRSAQTSAAPAGASGGVRLVETAHGHDAARAEAPASILAGKQLLIVEDEPLVALDIATTLEQAGAEIVGQAGTVAEALTLIESRAMDGALLDGNLGGQSVEDVALALIRRNVPFAFVTGYNREDLPAAFASAEVLSKPFSPAQLLETAAKLVWRPAEVLKLRN